MKHSNFFIHPFTFLLTALLSLPAWQGAMGQISVQHTLSICADSTVRSFGWNYSCQLGASSPAESNEPLVVSGIDKVVAVSVGYNHSLALRDDGTVWAWGDNYGGCAGRPYPTYDKVCSPYPVDLPGCAVAISAGSFFSLALLADSTVWAWGFDNVGQLGNGGSDSTSHIPKKVAGITNAVAISAGSEHALALLADSTVRSWGKGWDGRLGNGSSSDQFAPVQVLTAAATPITDVIQIEAGNTHSVVLRDNNTVYTWGGNFSGQLGLGNYANKSYATYSSGLSNGTVIDIAAGDHVTMTLRDNDSTWVAGSNYLRALGLSSPSSAPWPSTPIAGPAISGAIDIVFPPMGMHGWAFTSSGDLYAWGDNGAGAVGVGSTASSIAPPEHVNHSTSQNNCTAVPSPNNHPQPCCVAVYEDERTVLEDQVFTTSQTYSNLDMAIFGTITLNGGVHYFNGCDVVMGKDAKIIVNSGATLYIYNGSHLYACGDMWDGITVNVNGRIYVLGASIVEDAEVAVDLKYYAYYNLNNSTFNRNYVHVQKTMPSSGSSALTGDYRIVKCKFLCHDTPSVSGNYSTLLPPRAGERTSVGVLAMGVPKILVGNTLANANTFENSDWGVFTQGVKRVEVLYDNFRDIGVGTHAIGSPGLGGETINISYNDIDRALYGIICYDNDTTVRTRITYNNIDFDGMVSPPTYMTGITVSEVTPAPGGGKYNWADISNNTITKAPCGISMENLYGDQVGYTGRLYVGDNTITHSKPADNFQAGILMSNVTQPVVVENIINNVSGAPYMYWAETGIRMSGGGDMLLYCNQVHNIGRGIWVDGTISGVNAFVRNEMDNSQDGLLLNWGVIGVQGNSTTPHDNTWTNWNASNASTMVLGSSGASSRFYVRNPGTPSIYVPQNNWFGSSGSAIPLSSASSTWTSGCYFTGPAFKTDGSGAPEGFESAMAFLAEDAADTERGRSQQWMGGYGLYQTLLHDETLRDADESLNAFFTAQHTSNMGALHRAVNGFAAARNATPGAEVDAVTADVAALQGIQPQNAVEERLQELLSILYANAAELKAMNAEQATRLREIAQLCPLDDGLAVLMARAALHSIDTLPKGYMNACELVSPQDGEKWKQGLAQTAHFAVYPNPNNGQMTLDYTLEQGESGMVELSDLLGHQVFMQPLAANGSTKAIAMDGISPGLYILTVRVNDVIRLSERISIIKE
ncbi:MAG: T9SS type A sorting domain-containing protein [Flavobacteriales bacterium]|nr:T9SS type A sorting domain-containing protein [Flavobacteriales bacterium]